MGVFVMKKQRRHLIKLCVVCALAMLMIWMNGNVAFAKKKPTKPPADTTQQQTTTDQPNGQLAINQQVLQQKPQVTQAQHGNSNKAATDIPDLFDPQYTKGLAKEAANQQAGNRATKHQVFSKTKPQIDTDVKGIRKTQKHLFTGRKRIDTNAGVDPTTQSGSRSHINLPVVVITLIGFVLVGVVLGIKGQKLLFWRRKRD